MLKQYEREWTKADNRVRFVKEIISGKLVVQNKKRADIVAELRRRNYAPMRKNESSEEGNSNINVDEEEELQDNDHGYDYLLSMPIWNLTWEKVNQFL